MFAIAKRIINGILMIWISLLFLLRYAYIFGYGILLIVLQRLLQYFVPSLAALQEAAFTTPAPEQLQFSANGLLTILSIYLFFSLSTFIEIAVIKYIMEILNKDASPTKKRDSFYYAATQILPIMIWSIIIGSILIAGFFIPIPWIYILLVPVVFSTFFVPALIAEEKTPGSQLVPESFRILKAYWPEFVGFAIIPAGVGLGIYAFFYPHEFALNGPRLIASALLGTVSIGSPIFKAIIVQAAHHKNVGEDFAPYVKSIT